MRPAPFAYERAESVEDMLSSLAANGADGDDTVLLAGGQSLIPLLNARSVRPRRVLDIDGLTELEYLGVQGVQGVDGVDGVDGADAGLRIGALCRHATLERSIELVGPWAAWRSAARHVGLHPVRRRGTLGGSLADAHPGAELALAAVTFDAVALVRSLRGARRLPVAELLMGPHRTALRPDEAIVELRVDGRAPGTVSAFSEETRRAVGWPLASVCAVVRFEGGAVTDVALGVGAVGPVPLRLTEIEGLLVGIPLSDTAIDAAAAAAARVVDDLGEPAAGLDAASRRDLVSTLVRRTLDRVRDAPVAA